MSQGSQFTEEPRGEAAPSHEPMISFTALRARQVTRSISTALLQLEVNKVRASAAPFCSFRVACCNDESCLLLSKHFRSFKTNPTCSSSYDAGLSINVRHPIGRPRPHCYQKRRYVDANAKGWISTCFFYRAFTSRLAIDLTTVTSEPAVQVIGDRE